MRGRLPAELSGSSLALLASVCGLLIGSFLNVCIYRIPRDLSVVRPRSFCPECDAPVASWDNIPLLSFILLRGRCRRCGTWIGLRYPAVEVTTSLLFTLVVIQYGWSVAALKWLIFESLMIVLFWTDFETELLPDELTLGGSVAALALSFVVPVPGSIGDLFAGDLNPVWSSLMNLVSGGLLLSVPIWLTGWCFSKVVKQEALGFGDVKLLLLLGSFLGFDFGLQAVLAGTVGGAVVGGIWMILKRKQPFTQTLRFGCFLCAAAAFVPLLHKIGKG